LPCPASDGQRRGRKRPADFPRPGIFSARQLARFTNGKVLPESYFHPKGILKVLLNDTVTPSFSCPEEFKDENYSETVIHDVR
jgi:hypothetical protein